MDVEEIAKILTERGKTVSVAESGYKGPTARRRQGLDFHGSPASSDRGTWRPNASGPCPRVLECRRRSRPAPLTAEQGHQRQQRFGRTGWTSDSR